MQIDFSFAFLATMEIDFSFSFVVAIEIDFSFSFLVTIKIDFSFSFLVAIEIDFSFFWSLWKLIFHFFFDCKALMIATLVFYKQVTQHRLIPRTKARSKPQPTWFHWPLTLRVVSVSFTRQWCSCHLRRGDFRWACSCCWITRWLQCSSSGKPRFQK